METQTTLTGEPVYQNVGKSIAGYKSHARIQDYYNILVGHLRSVPALEVFPFCEGEGTPLSGEGGAESEAKPASAITTQEGERKENNFIVQLNDPSHSNNRVYGVDGVSPALNTAQGGNLQPKILDFRNNREMSISPTILGNDHNTIHRVIQPVLTPDRVEKRQNGRRMKDDGEEMFTITAQDRHGVYDGYSIRRLTPLECERLQSFPALKNLITFHIHKDNICLDLQKSYVNAEIQNHKLLKSVGLVEKTESKETAQFAEKSLNLNNQQIKEPVQINVHINCAEKRVEILKKQKEQLLSVNIVEIKEVLPSHIKIEDFALMIAGLNIIAGKIIIGGKEGLHQKEQNLIHQKNGEVSVILYGKETTQLANNVMNGSTIPNKHLKFTISKHLNLESIEQELIISFFYVVNAICGYIHQKTNIENILTIEVSSLFGWTEYGMNDQGDVMQISDSQRFKLIGNAVTTNVISAIVRKMMITENHSEKKTTVQATKEA